MKRWRRQHVDNGIDLALVVVWIVIFGSIAFYKTAAFFPDDPFGVLTPY